MKMLYVSPCNSWDPIVRNELVPHQLFGLYGLIDSFRDDGGELIGNLSESIGGGEVHFYFARGKQSSIFPMIKWFLASLKYDLIYDSHNLVAPLYGALKKIGLCRKIRIISILHNPSHFELSLRLGGADAYAFFCSEHLDYALRIRPEYASRCFLNEWYPDVNLYREFRERNKPFEVKHFYIDNGSVYRDEELLIAAIAKLGITITVPEGCVDNDVVIPECITPYKRDYSSCTSIMELLMSSKAVVVPLKSKSQISARRFMSFLMGSESKLLAPYGITSFLDAIALQIPIICSDNACFASLVIENKIGLVYETSSVSSLSEKLQQLYEDEELYNLLADNMKEFSKTHTIEQTSIRLRDIINKVIRTKDLCS